MPARANEPGAKLLAALRKWDDGPIGFATLDDPLVRKLVVGDGWACVSLGPAGRFPEAAQTCERCGRQRADWRSVWFPLTRKVVRCLRCGVSGDAQGPRRTTGGERGDLFAEPFEE